MLNLEVYYYKIDKNINKLKKYEVIHFKDIYDIYDYLINHKAGFVNYEDNKYYISYDNNDYIIYRLLT